MSPDRFTLTTVFRVAGLAWADAVVEGVLFTLQTYLTNVWKLSFTNAAALLNIWGGIYRIFPFFFLFLAETALGNFAILTFSAISSTAGVILIAVVTTPMFRKSIPASGGCQENAKCVAYTEKVIFITGMALIALGRAARSASTQPFINDQIEEDEEEDEEPKLSCWLPVFIVFFVFTLAIVGFAFQHVKRWYALFGISAACTVVMTLFYLSGVRTYKRGGPNPEGSTITDIFRVLVAAARKISQPYPQDSTGIHGIGGNRYFPNFSSSRILSFLYKAAIKLPNDKVTTKRSWRLCSVSQVESVKTIILMTPVWCAFIMCDLVSSAGNTYFVEQATHMNFNIGSWRAPIQLLLVLFTLLKYIMLALASPLIAFGKYGAVTGGVLGITFSVLCCTAAAAVERRRLHVVARHRLLDLPDGGEIPMSAAWLFFQVTFLSCLDGFSQSGLAAFHLNETPKSMKQYEGCFTEAITGLGFMSSVVSVYVVGKISDNWFQHTLNRSRLDRYFWVLSVLTSLNLISFLVIVYKYKFKQKSMSEEVAQFKECLGPELIGIKKCSALGLVLTHLIREARNIIRRVGRKLGVLRQG